MRKIWVSFKYADGDIGCQKLDISVESYEALFSEGMVANRVVAEALIRKVLKFQARLIGEEFAEIIDIEEFEE